MYRNRCRHDVVRAMLEAAKEKKSITDLCTSAGLPVDRGRRLVNLLLRYGLLVEMGRGEKGSGRYVITPRGYKWLSIYDKLEEVLPTE